MVLIGTAWGFIVVASATIVSTSRNPKLETSFNFAVAGMSAIISLGGAPAVSYLGWAIINSITAVAFLLLLTTALVWQTRGNEALRKISPARVA